MLYLSAVLMIGLISIFENGQTWGYSYKFTAITTPCKSIQKRSTRSLGRRLQAAQIDADTSEEPKLGGIPPWVAPFSTAAMGGLLFGSDIGCSSSVVRILGSKSAEFGALSALELGQIASSSLFGAMIASGLLVYFGDAKIGRKLEFQLASLLFFVGTLIQSLSPTLSLVYLGKTSCQ
jgi:Sugar (and other) transporter